MSLVPTLRNPALHLKGGGAFLYFSHSIDDRKLGTNREVRTLTRGRARMRAQMGLVPKHAAFYAVPSCTCLTRKGWGRGADGSPQTESSMPHNECASAPFANQVCSVPVWSHSNPPGFNLTVTCGKALRLRLPGTAASVLAR